MRFFTRKLERHDYIGMLYFAPALTAMIVARLMFHDHLTEINATDTMTKLMADLAGVSIGTIVWIITGLIFCALKLNPFPTSPASSPSHPATSTHASSTDTPSPAATSSAHPQPRPSPDA